MMEKKRILLIGTGGTIASEMGENGLTPELTSEQLLKYIPDISGICEISCCQLFSLDSTNIQPKHWARTPGPSGSGTGNLTALWLHTARTPWPTRRRD